MLPLILFAVLGLVIPLALIPLLRRQIIEKHWSRRGHQFHQTHHHPISRLGGLALGAAFLVVSGVALLVYPLPPERLVPQIIVILGALLMFGMGLWDDLVPLGAKRKLLAQLAIAGLVYALGLRIEMISHPFGGTLQLGPWSAAVTILWLVAFTNLINLIDGMDGLAGGIALMLMLVLVFVGVQSGSMPVIACGVVGSLVGFLIFNFPPAKIYLGDGGAYFLGFLIGEMSITSSHKGTVLTALIAPLFVLALPILDVSLAIVRRGLKGLPIFRADKGHIHHRLLEMGLSRRRALLGMYCFTLFFLLLAIVALRTRAQMLPLLAGAGMLFVLIVMGRMNFSRRWFNLGNIVGQSLRMRQEVAFAMSVTRWLALEGARVETTEELWKVFRFAAERLGFTGVQIDLPDGVRSWRHPDADFNYNGYQFARFDFRKQGAGLIELRARKLTKAERERCAKLPRAEQLRKCPLDEEKTFGLISDLLAESWHKANLLNHKFPGRLQPSPETVSEPAPLAAKPASVSA